MRIELTDEVVKAITMTCPYLNTDLRDCKEKCALNGACLEYWTGDNSLNKDDLPPREFVKSNKKTK